MRRSIRLRLLAAIMALAVPFAAGAGWLLVEVFASRMLRDVDVALEEEADTAAAFIAKPGGLRTMPEFMARLAAETDLGTGKQVMVERGGQLLGEWPSGARAALAARDPALRVARDEAGEGADRLTVAIGVRAAAAHAAKERLVALLALGIPAALVVLGIGLWAVMGRALRPLEQMARELGAIGGEDLSARLTTPAGDDEVGQIVAASNAMLVRLGASVAELERFTADAAHELRTPLAVLRAGLEVSLSRERSGGEYRAALEDALAGTGRLCRLAEDLLTLARIDAAAPERERGPIAMEEMLHELADAWSPVCSPRAVRIEVGAPAGVAVLGNPGDLYRLFNNLIDNAVAHSPEGGRVLLDAEAAPPWAHVTIADEGTGVRADEAERIFDRFYRGAGAAEIAGSGLGLSIARKIAAAHGGEIVLLDGANGAGCALRVTLPLA